MKIIEIAFPGIVFFSSLSLLVMGTEQFRLFLKEKHQRSKYLGIFCLISGFFALNEVIIYSNAFPVEYGRNFILCFQFLLFLGLFYYMKSLSFFIVVPKWLKYFYYRSMMLFMLLAILPPIALFVFGKHIYFNPDHIYVTGNFFSDAYTARMGQPYIAPLAVLSLFSVVHSVTSVILLIRVFRSSKDWFLIIGFAVNIVACAMEFFVLPLTVDYYVPMSFVANLFEAIRMCYLSSREDLVGRESCDLSSVVKDENSYRDISIDEEKIESLGASLVSLMEKEKLYLNPNLKVSDLGYKLRVPDYLISQGIRFALNKNFYQWVNEYRVREVQKRLRSDVYKDRTIVDIAYESGFNSKSSFNSVFKKIVGCTPSIYRENNVPEIN